MSREKNKIINIYRNVVAVLIIGQLLLYNAETKCEI